MIGDNASTEHSAGEDVPFPRPTQPGYHCRKAPLAYCSSPPKQAADLHRIPQNRIKIHSKTGIWTQPFHRQAGGDVGRFKFNLIDRPQPSARPSPPRGAPLSPHPADRSPPHQASRAEEFHALTHAPNFLFTFSTPFRCFLCSFSRSSSTCVGALKEQLRRLTSPCDVDGDKVST